MNTPATIRITDLSLRAIIGINDWEREQKQDIIINIALDFDAAAPARSDDVKDTIDYKSLKQRIMRFVESSEYFLLEKLTDQVLGIVLEDPKVLSAWVRIDKPAALRFAKSVSVEMRRSKN